MSGELGIKRFAQLVEGAMRKRGLLRVELARGCGLSSSTISRILEGRQVPGAETINKIATFLGFDWATLYEALEGNPTGRELTNKMIVRRLNQLDDAQYSLATEQIEALLDVLQRHQRL